MHFRNGLAAVGILLAFVLISPVASASFWPDNSTMHGPDITWSGRTWWVCDWAEYRADYVTIDSNGWMHLRQSGHGDSGVITYDKCGYGTYTWVMQGVHNIDRYAVIGMDPYLSESGTSEQWREIDIEQAKWGNGAAGANNFDFWVQPNSQHVYQVFTLPYTDNDTTFVIDWERSFIQFYILDTVSSHLLRSWNATATRNATGCYGTFNAWHYLQPTTMDTNVIFKSFSYERDMIFHPPSTSYPPEITSTPSMTVNEGAGYSYAPTASGSPTWTCTGRPAGMVVNSGTGAITWASAVIGDYPLVLTATNSIGTDTQSFTLHVRAVIEPPEITSTPQSLNATVGTSYSYQPTGTNNPTWTCTGRPNGMTIDEITGALTWLNPVAGDYPLTLVATNSAGTDSQSFTLNVTNISPIPDHGITTDEEGDSAAVIAHEASSYRYTNAGGIRTDTKPTTISKWWYVGAVIVSITAIMAIVMNNGGGQKSRRSHKRRSSRSRRRR